MIHHAHQGSEEAKVAELKRLITSRQFDSVEMLEDAVDHLLWGEEPDCEGAAANGPSNPKPPAASSESSQAES